MTRTLPIQSSANITDPERAGHELEDSSLARLLTEKEIDEIAGLGVGAVAKWALNASRQYDAWYPAACKEAKLNYDEEI